MTYYSNRESHRLKAGFLHRLNLFEITGNTIEKETAARYKNQYDSKLKELRKLVSSANIINNSENKTKSLWNLINRERRAK